MSNELRNLVVVGVALFILGMFVGNAIARTNDDVQPPTRAPLVVPSPLERDCLPNQATYPGVYDGHYNGSVCVPD